MTHNTDRPEPAPPAWSYSTPPSPSAQRWRVNRTKILLAIAVVVVLCGGLLTWLAIPSTAPPRAADESYEQRSSLADQPPTVIVNALQLRTLYPSGYVPFDASQSKKRGSSRSYDPDERHESTATPAGCERDPTSLAGLLYRRHDDESYSRYPVSMVMFPAGDPGGNGRDKGFWLHVFPADNPNQVHEWRQWFTKCENAQITSTTTKNGEIIDRKTYTHEPDIIIDAPRSAADTAFIKAVKRKSGNVELNYIGEVRGMIVTLECSEANKKAGDALFQTVILRIQEI